MSLKYVTTIFSLSQQIDFYLREYAMHPVSSFLFEYGPIWF